MALGHCVCVALLGGLFGDYVHASETPIKAGAAGPPIKGATALESWPG